MKSWFFLANTVEWILFFNLLFLLIVKSPDASISCLSCSEEIKNVPFFVITFLLVTLIKLIYTFFICTIL